MNTETPEYDLYAKPCPVCKAAHGDPCQVDGYTISRMTHVDRRYFVAPDPSKGRDRS